MAAPESSAASFLNVDLELTSAEDLSPLLEHFGSSVFVLYSGEVEGGYRLAVEPEFEGRLSPDVNACLARLIELAELLPAQLAALWARCTCRTFDLGFDGGYEEAPLHVEVPANLLARISRLEASVRITVYPYRATELTNSGQSGDGEA